MPFVTWNDITDINYYFHETILHPIENRRIQDLDQYQKMEKESKKSKRTGFSKFIQKHNL